MTISNEPKFGESFVCLVCGKHYPIGEIVIKELEDFWVDRKDGINVLCFLCYVEGIINSGNAKILPDSVKEEYFKRVKDVDVVGAINLPPQVQAIFDELREKEL